MSMNKYDGYKPYKKDIETGRNMKFPINMGIARCYRCLHMWVPRVEPVKTCSKCRSPYWDKARRKYDGTIVMWAKGMMNKAKKYGYLGKPKDFKCVDCGAVAEHWEHRSYARPLMVEPVCRKCNIRRGSSINYDEKYYEKND